MVVHRANFGLPLSCYLVVHRSQGVRMFVHKANFGLPLSETSVGTLLPRMQSSKQTKNRITTGPHPCTDMDI